MSAGNRADAKNAVSQANTKRFESRKPFLERKLRLYFETAKVVGTLVAEPLGTIERMDAKKRFWSLYWSELAMVVSESIEAIMIKIGEAIEKCADQKSLEAALEELKNNSYDLSHQIRDEIEAAWSAEYPC